MRSNTRTMKLKIIASLGLLLFVQISFAGPPPHYVAFELGALPGSSNSYAFALNNSGEIIGASQTASGEIHSVLFRGREVIDLGAIYSDGLLGGWDINDSGQYVVPGYSPTFDRHTVTLPEGYSIAVASGLNNSGVVAGLAAKGFGPEAFLYSNGVFNFLEGPVPGLPSAVSHVNNYGQAVGVSDVILNESQTTPHAVLFSDGHAIDLGTLPGSPLSSAYNLNDLGHVVGISPVDIPDNLPPRLGKGFLYRDGVMTPLIELPGFPETFPAAINGTDQIVGTASWTYPDGLFSYNTINVGFIQIGEASYNINTLLPRRHDWTVTYLSDINEAGWIVGTVLTHGVYRAVLL